MIERHELHDTVQKAFPKTALKPDRDATWRRIAEMGWLMLPLSEELGGLGLGREAAAAIHFELGRVLSTAPLIPAMLTVQAIGGSETLAEKADWIERVCGDEFVTLSLLPNQGSCAFSREHNAALSRQLTGVPDADMASHVLVCTRDRAALVPLEGAIRVERPAWDKSRRLFDVTLREHEIDPALIVAEGESAHRLMEGLQTDLAIGLAADSLGGANGIFDLTVDYLKTRKQFDRPLALFQALKHRCADLKTHISAAEALLWSLSITTDVPPVKVGGLKAHAAEIYRFVCEESIQLHGGIGLTEEFHCHLFMKRANLNVQLGGNADQLREAVGRAALAIVGAHD